MTGTSQDEAGKKVRGSFSLEVQVDVVALSAENGGLRAMSSLKTSGNHVTPYYANVKTPLLSWRVVLSLSSLRTRWE